MFQRSTFQGLLGKALDQGEWQLHTINIRDFARDTYGTVDDTPFGGGAGMVMRPDVVGDALEKASESLVSPRYIFPSPRGKRIQQSCLQMWSRERRPLVFLCGRYEGVDQRVLDVWNVEEVSLGDFILMGGEIPALAMIEGTVRLLPEVLGNPDSLKEESFQGGLLEYPLYTRPRQWKGLEVPSLLLEGNHARIRLFRQQEREKITQTRRPDLWEKYWTEKDWDGKKKEE
jgi:tRNA (guanine37-N1)-methyltransferase